MNNTDDSYISLFNQSTTLSTDNITIKQNNNNQIYVNEVNTNLIKFNTSLKLLASNINNITTETYLTNDYIVDESINKNKIIGLINDLNNITSTFVNYYTKTESNNLYYNKTYIDNLIILYYTKIQIDNLIALYYTKTQIDNILLSYYTKTQIDNILNSYITSSYLINNYYDKSASDNLYYNKTYIDNLIILYYTKTQIDNILLSYYTKTQIDNILNSYITSSYLINNYYDKSASDNKFALISSLNNKLDTSIYNTDQYNLSLKFFSPLSTGNLKKDYFEFADNTQQKYLFFSQNTTNSYQTINFINDNTLQSSKLINNSIGQTQLDTNFYYQSLYPYSNWRNPSNDFISIASLDPPSNNGSYYLSCVKGTFNVFEWLLTSSISNNITLPYIINTNENGYNNVNSQFKLIQNGNSSTSTGIQYSLSHSDSNMFQCSFGLNTSGRFVLGTFPNYIQYPDAYAYIYSRSDLNLFSNTTDNTVKLRLQFLKSVINILDSTDFNNNLITNYKLDTNNTFQNYTNSGGIRMCLDSQLNNNQFLSYYLRCNRDITKELYMVLNRNSNNTYTSGIVSTTDFTIGTNIYNRISIPYSTNQTVQISTNENIWELNFESLSINNRNTLNMNSNLITNYILDNSNYQTYLNSGALRMGLNSNLGTSQFLAYYLYDNKDNTKDLYMILNRDNNNNYSGGITSNIPFQIGTNSYSRLYIPYSTNQSVEISLNYNSLFCSGINNNGQLNMNGNSIINCPSLGGGDTYQNLTSQSNINWNWSSGNIANLTLTNNTILSITHSGISKGKLIIKQDSNGSRTLNLSPGIYKQGSTNSFVQLSTSANSIDVLNFFKDNNNEIYLENTDLMYYKIPSIYTLNYSGSIGSLTIISSQNNICRIRMIGAGGGQGVYSTGGSSGAGGYTIYHFYTTNYIGQELKYIVGEGGQGGFTYGNPGYGGYPNGGNAISGDTYPGGGGGRCDIRLGPSNTSFYNSTILAIAGGGGGGSGYSSSGGAGGGLNGQNNQNNSSTGGSQISGGTSNPNGQPSIINSGFLQGAGGNGIITSSGYDCGGGGDGYYGGGISGGDGQSGSGGSGYINMNLSGYITYYNGESSYTYQGNYTNIYSGALQYFSNYGYGYGGVSSGTIGLRGGNGQIIVEFF